MILRLYCIHLLIASIACVDLFSSMAALENMIETENELDKMVEDYLVRETARLERIRELLREGKKEKSEDEQSEPGVPVVSEESTFNPIDIFQDIKRIVNKRNSLMKLLVKTSETNLYLLLTNEVMPSREDVTGAAMALLRLQDTYQLKPADIADGKIGEFAHTTPLTADDTFKVGFAAFKNKDYYHALQWLLITKDKIESEKGTTLEKRRSFNVSVVFDQLAYSMSERKNPAHALWYSRTLNEIDPQLRSKKSLDDYQQIFNESGSNWDGSWENLPPVINERPMDEVDEEYEALCRGETGRTPSELSKLYCFRQQNTPYLKLAPMNVEIVNFDPYAVVFRGILTDSESEHLKRIASPRLKRAMIVYENRESTPNAGGVVTSYRVAKNMWLKDSDDKIAAKVSRRLGEVTGLSMETAEQLQMSNYGLGGHYVPHYDAALEDSAQFAAINTREGGNRIATGLFYMSQPVAGGATVFADLDIAVFPSKNDCLFWFNILKNGEPDMRTRHGGCPVLLGQKWVANKWIHERGQEFRRPCDLKAEV